MNDITMIKAIIILQIDGRQIISRYYDDKLTKKQSFEQRLFAKTKILRSKEEVITIDGLMVLHRFMTDSHIYVVGEKEDVLKLDGVLNCLVDVISSFSSNNITSNSVLDNSNRVMQALDLVCEGGLILEIDPNLILQRIPMQEESVESMVQVYGKRLFGSVYA